MKVFLNIFLIIVAGGAIFFSMKQQDKFQQQQDTRLKVTAKEKEVATNANATEKNLKDERVALAASREKLALVKSSIDALKASETSLKREIATVESSLAEQQSELAALDKAIADVSDLLKNLNANVTIDNLGDEIVKMDASLKEKKKKVEELTTLIDGAEKKIATGKTESKRLSDRSIESSVRISRNAMEAVVTAVNQDWGFLVIGAGSNSGFTPQSTLLVKRDGKLIGRVKPTAIEATQTVGDIDLDSLGAGVRIQPGDRVIVATPAAN